MKDMAVLRERLKTVVVTTVTPLQPDGSIDYATAARHARFLVDHGIQVVVPAGNTGEFASLGLDETHRLVATVVDAVADRAMVLAGVGWSMPIAVDLARRAQDAGAHGIMIHHPVHTYSHPRGLQQYYEKIMDAIDIGVLLYKRGPELPDALVADLVQSDQVIGVKYAENDVNAFTNLVASSDAPVTWLCGTAERWAPFFHLGGAAGFSSGLANFAPEKPLQLHAALSARDYVRAMAIRAELAPFEELRQRHHSANNVPAVKEAMSILGFCDARVRDPLLELDDQESESVRQIVASWGLGVPDAPAIAGRTQSMKGVGQ
ncbi:MAG TPA: dihydrodipicolinate synthase family protein [Chloroflexota bacterium]|nr:dihydrodipicolinate synthase family protein [Chloroflexota bacterium]